MRSTKAELQRRIEEVFRLRLGGAGFLDVRDFARAPEQSWNVSDSQLWRYIQAADALVKEHGQANREFIFARSLLRHDQVWAHAMGAGDFRTALAAEADLLKLVGAYAPTKTEHHGKDGAPITLNITEVIVRRPAPAALPVFKEEVIRRHDANSTSTDATAPAAGEDRPPA
jgi:hypothetical protein